VTIAVATPGGVGKGVRAARCRRQWRGGSRAISSMSPRNVLHPEEFARRAGDLKKARHRRRRLLDIAAMEEARHERACSG